jgi:hypothetical protein
LLFSETASTRPNPLTTSLVLYRVWFYVVKLFPSLLRDAGVMGKGESVPDPRFRTCGGDEIPFPCTLFPSLDGILSLRFLDELALARVNGTKSLFSASPTKRRKQ